MSQLEFLTHFNGMERLLYAFAVQLTKDKADAEDLLQETAYKAFKYRRLYQPHTNLRAWLMTIMRNTFINDYRKRVRRQTLQDQSAGNYFLESNKRPVHNDGEGNLTVEELQVMIQQVEEWARIPFLLYQQGYKYEEIAEELNAPLGTIKSRIFFARKQLREMVRKHYGTECPEELLSD